VGCASGPTESVNASYAALHQRGRLPGLTLLRCLPSGPAAGVAIRHGLRGPNQTYASACASSSVAIGEALRAIRHGYLDMALAGGTEAPFGDGTLKAWEALRMLAPLGEESEAEGDASSVCRPFDRSRCGIVLGEGAVFYVLESAEKARARGATVLACLAGYAASGDAHHWTEPSAEGQVRAMTGALADARLSPHDIGYINAYGPGTPMGDRVEASSIAEVFGAGAAGPWVSSTKATHGHLLGASGAIELAASVVALHTGRVPPTRNLREPDEHCPANLVRGTAVPLPAGRAVLSNSFAFGGSNACLVVCAA
jgi:3-oxoacyl-[acyl-carrier-protein] synthase II